MYQVKELIFSYEGSLPNIQDAPRRAFLIRTVDQEYYNTIYRHNLIEVPFRSYFEHLKRYVLDLLLK